jgi:hypothetical protein
MKLNSNFEKSEFGNSPTKHHKRAPKRKKWVLRWSWSGNRTGMDKLQLMFHRDFHERYATEGAATQALSDWKRGRGIYGKILKVENGWSAEIISPEKNQKFS